MDILVDLIFEIFKKARRRTSFETGSKSTTTPSIQAGTRKVQRATFFSWGVDNEDEDQGDGSEDYGDQGSEGDDGGR